MMKHVGLYNAQKITVVLHKMPAEDHMCLCLIDDKLPPRYFQAVKNALVTPAAQEAKDFATALDGVLLEDGRGLAYILHTEGHLKKVPTNQVFMTPFGYDANNKKIRLSELNDMLGNIEQGGDALQKLKDFDEGKGLNKKTKSATNSDAPINLKEQTELLPTPQQVRDIVDGNNLVSAISNAKDGKLILDSKQASVELYAQGENLRTVAAQLLQQAKLLTIKAEQLYPNTQKRGRGRPKGTGLKSKA